MKKITKYLVVLLVLSVSLAGCGETVETKASGIDMSPSSAYNIDYDDYGESFDEDDIIPEDELWTIGLYTEEDIDEGYANSYEEGYTDVLSGYNRGYDEVYEDDLAVPIDDYYDEDLYNLYCAAGYTEGFNDAVAGRYPKYGCSEEREELEEIPDTPPKQEQASAPAQTAPAPSPSTSSAETQSVTVYITRTGECYHRGSCYHLRQSKIATTLSQAKAIGYRACSHCSPPQ